MVNRERKAFGLRQASRKPKSPSLCVSSTVSVVGAFEQGYCYVNFCHTNFVEFVGKKMPRGVAAFDPCFIEVTQRIDGWLVESVYVRDGTRSPLWLAKEKPEWVGALRKEAKNGGTEKKQNSPG